ncbi:MAG: hypothetical protein ABEK36_04410 [Candidatus Aenigmatarchaeota archaeon]
MGVPQVNVVHYNDDYATGSALISNFQTIKTEESTEEKISSFEVTGVNVDNYFADKFEVGDKLKIEGGWGHTGSTLIYGKITNPHEEHVPGMFHFEGKTNNDVLITRMAVGWYKNDETDWSGITDEEGNELWDDGTGLGSQKVTSARIIRDVLRQFALGPSGTEPTDANLIHFKLWDNTEERGIKANTKEIVDDSGNNREVIVNWETLLDTIIRLSSEEYAGQEHWFYVDNDAYLTWRPKSELPEKTDTLTYGKDILKCSFKYELSKEKNFFVINCGRDLNDSQDILVFVYDIYSIAENGFREELIKDTSDRNRIAEEGTYTGDNDGFIDAVSEATKKRYTANLISMSNIKWEGMLTVNGSTGYTLGKKIRITHEKYGFDELVFIIRSVKHSINEEGWKTELRVVAEEYGREGDTT